MELVAQYAVEYVVVAGAAAGIAAASDEPLSFWGGLNPATGEIIDRRHPLSGVNIAGGMLVLPCGRGSCSASGVFLEAIRNGFAPAGVIVSRIDPIIGLGSILGDELYKRSVPIVVISSDHRARIRTGDYVDLGNDGTIRVYDAVPAVAGRSRDVPSRLT